MHAICLWAPLDSVQQRGSQRSLKAPNLVTSLSRKKRWSHENGRAFVSHQAGKAYAPKFHSPGWLLAARFSALWKWNVSYLTLSWIRETNEKITDMMFYTLKKIPTTMFFSYKISLQTIPWTPRFRFPGIRATFWPEDPGEQSSLW